jgi:hypothetical protein
MNEILCPNCGKANPPESDFCVNCLAPLNLESKSESSSEGSQPEWLQRIREHNQDEPREKPPLGQFGDAEKRPFDQPVTPGEIPDWLKEIQNLEPPQKPEPIEDNVDWIAKLHEIKDGSSQSLSQSTTFYSDEELAAMAAAARNSEQEVETPADKTPEAVEERVVPLDENEQPSEPQYPVKTPSESEKIIVPSDEIQPEEDPGLSQPVDEEPIASVGEQSSPIKSVVPQDESSETLVPDLNGETDFSFLIETKPEEESVYQDNPEPEIQHSVEERKNLPIQEKKMPNL